VVVVQVLGQVTAAAAAAEVVFFTEQINPLAKERMALLLRPPP